MGLALTASTLVWLLSWSFTVVTAQGNTTCKTTSLDWYTSTVGETPCQTYQRLRQICNAAYTVGSLSPSTPPDTCNDQVDDCCCNSISFALSMLCLNCQQGVGSGINGDNGIDAGVGAYQEYLGTCQPNVNKSLPNDIQAAVCNDKIKIDDDLYSLFWSDGAWFYMYTRETIQKDQQTFANNTYTHCVSTTINNSTTTTTSTSAVATTTTSSANLPGSTGSSGRSSSSLSAGTIAGIAIGSMAALLSLLGVLFWLLWKRRRDSSFPDKISSLTQPEIEQVGYQIEPFISPSSSASVGFLASYNKYRSTLGPSEGSLGYPSQTQSSSSTTQPSGRSKKTKLVTISQPDSDNLSIGRSPPVSRSSPYADPLTSLSSTSSDALAERHADGGPLLGRSPSGRLPPAYGEQRDGV